MSKRLRVLFVGGSTDDTELTLVELRRAGFAPSGQRVGTAREMRIALERRPWDAILADDTLPGFNVPSALRLLRKLDLDLPLIVVSPNSDDERAGAMMRAGARDYLLKSSLTRLGPALERELRNAAVQRARRTAEDDNFRLATIVQHTEVAVIGKDLDGVITSWNPAAERLYGWTAAEAIGRHISIVVPPYLRTELAGIMDQLRRGESVLQHQTVRYRKDRTELQTSLTVLPIRDAGGKLIGHSTFARDITERKWLDEQLRRSELRFRCLFESDAVAMGCWNIDGRITDANSALLRLIGYTREEMEAGQVRWIDITPPEYAHLDAKAVEELRATGTCQAFEKEYIRKDQSRVPVLIAAAVFENGVTDAGAFFVVDLTERKKVEDARQQQTRILNSILSSMGDGVVVADEYGKFLHFNSAAEQILGIGEMEAHPAEWSERYRLYLPDQVTPYPAQDIPLARAMRGESVFATEMFVRNEKSPHGVWISVTARPLRNETGEPCGGVAVFQDVTERKLAEERQRNLASDRNNLVRQLELQIKRMPLAYALFDSELRVVDWNPAAESMFGYRKEEVLGMEPPFKKITPPAFWDQTEEILRRIRSGDMSAHSVNDNLTKDGRTITCEWINTPLVSEDRQFNGLMSLALNVTDRKHLEEQLRQSQKMDAIGQLAGGIAHDFNNFLTAISIYNHLLINSLSANDTAQPMLQEIRKVSERSASLTRQLLAFGRKQVLAPRILCLNEVVRGTEEMFRRVIGEDVQLVTVMDPRLDNVMADPEQLERVLLNLVVNARDAMPRGGKLTIETKNVVREEVNRQGHFQIPLGRYVMLTVTDAGVGMSPETKCRLFEPFFTTKAPETASGLGLAVVHGIIKQSEGYIEVESEPGHGACFKIYLPRVDQLVHSHGSSPMLAPHRRGTETILRIDDDEALR